MFATVFQFSIQPGGPGIGPANPFALAAAILGLGFLLASFTIPFVGRTPSEPEN